jgi:cell wall assembly regulator SMI1
MDTIDDLWNRIEAYLAVHAPTMLAGLEPGAGANDIEELERAVGHRLPDDVRASLARHNGQRYENGDPVGGTLIPRGYTLASTGVILDEWKDHRAISEDVGNGRDPDVANPRVRPLFLHAAWMPIAVDIGGNSICVDLAPGDGGSYGQILDKNHELDTPTWTAESYQSWFSQIVDDLEAGATSMRAEVLADSANETSACPLQTSTF